MQAGCPGPVNVNTQMSCEDSLCCRCLTFTICNCSGTVTISSRKYNLKYHTGGFVFPAQQHTNSMCCM